MAKRAKKACRGCPPDKAVGPGTCPEECFRFQSRGSWNRFRQWWGGKEQARLQELRLRLLHCVEHEKTVPCPKNYNPESMRKKNGKEAGRGWPVTLPSEIDGKKAEEKVIMHYVGSFEDPYWDVVDYGYPTCPTKESSGSSQQELDFQALD